MTTFTLSLAEFAKAAPEQARAVVRRVSEDVLINVVMKTPVGNPANWASVKAGRAPPPGYVGGRLRANWVTSFGAPSYRVTTDTDKGGQVTIARGARTIARSYGDYPIYITNSLPYAIPVEYGHSKSQAPGGMVRITVAEFQTFVDNAVRTTKAAK